MAHKRKRHKLIVQTQFSRITGSFESKAAALEERKRLRESLKRSNLLRGTTFSIVKE
jgi:hypothetical protein